MVLDRPIFYMMVAPPASGKSYYVQQNAKQTDVVLSSDAIRIELFADVNCQENNNKVFEVMRNRTIDALNNGKNVWYDATNMTRKSRKSIMSQVPAFVQKIAVVVWNDIDVMIEQDKNRDRHVGKYVIMKMLKRYQPVWYDEGFDEIKIISQSFDILKSTDTYLENMKIPHDNPHHKLNVYEHSIAASKYFTDHYSNIEIEHCVQNITNNYTRIVLHYAVMFHDIGKPYTKQFLDAHGNPSEIAHYYGHDCVGGWLALSIMNDPLLSWLVGNHMLPFFDSSYYKKLPPLYKWMIDLIHEADIQAH